MDELNLKEWLSKYKAGKLTEAELLRKLKFLPYKNLSFARLDYHRQLRIGLPEVIFGEGKSLEQMQTIMTKMTKDRQPVMATRVDRVMAASLKKRFSRGRYNPISRTFTISTKRKASKGGAAEVCVISAGTSDLPVAEEARETLEFLGVRTATIYDVGVAGLHRFLGEESKLEAARALIVVAGMEGALASVVGGICDKPIIAVPTSIGYGTSLAGLSPLLSMLNACSSGIAVVNIDNGFGAACAVYRIIRMLKEKHEGSDI